MNSKKYTTFLAPLFIVLCLSIIRWQFGVLFFHTLAELFSVMIGVLMLVIAWNTRQFTHNDFLLYLGIGYFWIAILDTWHTFTIKGIPFFNIVDAEITLHFWIYTRLIEALLLLSAVLFLKKKLHGKTIFISGGIITLIVSWISFSFTFPVMLNAEGLTIFKIASEIAVIIILVTAIIIYILKRALLAPRVLYFLIASMSLTICAELFFTLYTNFHGIPFVIGHLFKFLSFWMIYQAIVQTTLKEPFSVMSQASNSYNAIPHPAIVVDNQGNISQVNRAAENMCRKTSFQIMEKPIHQYFHPHNVSENDCELCQSIKNGKVLDAETVYFPEYKRWYLISLATIKVEDITSGMIQTLTDITEQQNSKIALKNSETHLNTLVQTLPDLVWLKDTDGVYLDCNSRFESFFGAKKSEILGKTDYDFLDKELADFFRQHDKKAIDAGVPSMNEEEVTFADDGHKELLETIKTPMLSPSGKLDGVLGLGRNITARKQAEDALLRVQKMDAIGQLTGGIAHDFNNILAIVLGNLELLEMQTVSDDKLQKRIKIITNSTQRAVDLTKQLLSFSRGQPAQQTVTNINQLIRNMNELIARSITPEVEVVSHLSGELWLTKIDPGNFEDSLLNLILNSRDAMSGHGHLTIETHNTTLDSTYCQKNHGVLVGEYVELVISDNGEGMSAEQQEHIFEPFFTTKEQGKGTGLGLSMVFGFVKRSKGHIKCYSEQDIGTTFRLYLPRNKQDEHIIKQDKKLVITPGKGSETILVVDDEPGLVDIAKETLEAQGYKILTASDGNHALEILNNNPSINLLFSDVVMPGGINGYQLSKQALDNRPDIKILLASGYSEEAVLCDTESSATNNILSKPYSHFELLKQIRNLLDSH